ncbi:MAG TPA: DUF58 domain-containing protein [Caulobacteraceae bacterium]|nr:DUF58 domain-containing protein [Caulobacteraceae bacterium]
MIYPTRLAIALMAVGAPAALLIGLIAPGWWVVGGGWAALILGLVLVDALVGPSRASAVLSLETPGVIGIGGRGELTLRADFERAAPRMAEIAVETNARLTATPVRLHARFHGSQALASARLTPVRRGEGEISTLWLRWRGPLGLVWKQVREAPARKVAVTPNIQAVKDEAIRLFSREAMFGLKTQLETGEGSEFHALRELVGGMDPRTIDWKQSARHTKLLAKEFRTERNHPVVFAIDTGRLMCDPIAGVPRVDRSINAALLLAYVSLKLGDRAAMYGFDAKPRLFSGVVAGAGAFPLLQRVAARLDYSDEETNFTLGLTQLGTALERRSLVVVFTDFADSTSAELMLENVARLLRRHLVLFVVLRDEELEGIARREPVTADDVSRAVTAAAMMREREVVVGRLRRLGAHIVDAPADRLGPALISAYLDLKRRDLM